MKNKSLLIVCFILLLGMLGSISANISATRELQVSELCPYQELEIVGINGSDYLIPKCISDILPTINPPTPTVEPTATIVPTSTIQPSPTPTQTVSIPPYPEAPLCSEHDDRMFHTLWNEQLGCHYTHMHGDNPHDLDDVFGTDVYTYFGADNGGYAEISYPWQTFTHHGTENEMKHPGYIWKTGEDLGCTLYFGNPGCITDYRALVHGMATAIGATTASHSFWIEARVCLEGEVDCGIIRTGGWQGPASLTIDNNRFLLDRRGLDVYGNVMPFPTDQQRNFLHYYNVGNQCCGTWYTGQKAGGAGFVMEFGDMWETVPPIDTNGDGIITAPEIVENAEPRFDMLPDGSCGDFGCRNNGSRIQTHLIVTGGWPVIIRDQYDPDGDGVGNMSVFVDRMGFISNTCEEVGEDCIPLRLENFPMVLAQYRGEYTDYDIYFGNETSGWLRYPNYTP